MKQTRSVFKNGLLGWRELMRPHSLFQSSVRQINGASARIATPPTPPPGVYNVSELRSQLYTPTALGHLGSKLEMFKKNPTKDMASWRNMITACNSHSEYLEAFELYKQMRAESDSKLDKETLLAIMDTVIGLHDSSQARAIHSLVSDAGLESDPDMKIAIMKMYARVGTLQEACNAFDKIKNPDVATWTALVGAYCRLGNYSTVLQILDTMESEGAVPDEDTYITIANTCVAITVEEGKKLQQRVKAKLGQIPPRVGTAIIDMFAKKFGSMLLGRACHDASEKSASVYAATMRGYLQLHQFKEAIEITHEMQEKCVEPDAEAFSYALYACAEAKELEEGKALHYTVMEYDLHNEEIVMNALVTMYARCEALEEAKLAFSNMERKDVSAWSAVIGILGIKGETEEALRLTRKMQQEGVILNKIAFVDVLTACAYGGLVDEAGRFFVDMRNDYLIRPEYDHWNALVDTIAKKGRLQEAEDLIRCVPMQVDEKIWYTLLRGCETFGDMERRQRTGEIIMKINNKLDPLGTGANKVAARWEEAKRVRKLMTDRGIKKEPGKSMISIKNTVHGFVAQDRSHPHTREIYTEVDRITKVIKEMGYIPDTRYVLHDVPEDKKERLLWYHSERLAMAYGHLHTPPGEPLRVIKNLRVCGDCHSASKLYAKVMQREIIVRDNRRFHHFSKEGTCSCGDYW